MCQASLSRVVRPCRQLHTLEIDLCFFARWATEGVTVEATMVKVNRLSFGAVAEILGGNRKNYRERGYGLEN